MNTLKRLATLAMTVSIISAGFTGCSNSNSTTATTKAPETTETTKADEKTTEAGKTSDGGTIEVIAKGFQHDFWKAVKIGADKAGTEMGYKVNFVGPEGEGAIASQVEMFGNAINKKPNAICFAALDTKASLDAIIKAQTNKIPIIGFDSGVPDAPEGSVVANASTDNYKAGSLASEKMFPAIQTKVVAAANDKAVRIGVVSQEANSQSIKDRTSGFIDDMVKKIEALPEYGVDKVAVTGHTVFANKVDVATAKVVIDVRIPSDITDALAKTEAQNLLEKEDIIAIYGSNEFAAKAIVNANDALAGDRIGIEEGKIIAVGFDSGALQIDAIKNNKFLGSVTQDPVAIGYKAVELAVKAAKGEAVSDVDTGCKWYDSTNVDNEDIKPLLYQ